MNFNPRNIIVDVYVNSGKGWNDDTVRKFVNQGYTIYRMRPNQLTISGRETFTSLSKHQMNQWPQQDLFFRIKFPYSEDGKSMITWMLMQTEGGFKILDTTHRKEVCSPDS